jgi:hypothetical protein
VDTGFVNKKRYNKGIERGFDAIKTCSALVQSARLQDLVARDRFTVVTRITCDDGADDAIGSNVPTNLVSVGAVFFPDFDNDIGVIAIFAGCSGAIHFDKFLALFGGQVSTHAIISS